MAMQLNTGAGAQTPIPCQDGAKTMRFNTLAGTTAKLHVMWGESGTPVEVDVTGHAGSTPVAGSGSTVTRVDGGTNPVAVVVF